MHVHITTNIVGGGEFTSASLAWTKTGSVKFGKMLIDFTGKKVLIEGKATPISDCSNDDNLCLNGAAFSLVLPKICVRYQERTWSVGRVSSTLLAVDNSAAASKDFLPQELPFPGGAALIYLIGSIEHKNVVFAHENYLGIRRIYIGAAANSDLLTIAKTKGVAGLDASGALVFDADPGYPAGKCFGDWRQNPVS